MSYISTNFKTLIADPSRCSDLILADLQAVTGNEVVDASNAFVMLLEATTQLASHNWTSNALGLKKRYASLATTFEEIYPHLSSNDIQAIFARPTKAKVRFSILVESLLATAVNMGGYREAIIPKYTEITVDDMTFSVDEAISIKVYSNRVFKVEYVGGSLIHNDIALLNTLTTFTREDSAFWVTFEVEVQQLEYTMYTFNSLPSITINETMSYVDQLSSIEVLYKTDAGYIPMQLSLTSRAYDPLIPTAILVPDITLQQLQVFIPPMYTKTTVTGDIKVIIGTTKGDVDRVFSHYVPGDYSIGLDSGILMSSAAQSAFLSSTYTVELTTPLDGGRDALTFEALRSRVVGRAFGNKLLPITRGQFVSTLGDSGLLTMLYKEGVGGRTYIVTDDTPNPTLPNTQPPLPVDSYMYGDTTVLPTSIPSVPSDYLNILAKGQTYTGTRSQATPYDTFLPMGVMTLTTHYEALSNVPGIKVFPYRSTITPNVLFSQSGSEVVPSLVNAMDIDLLSDENKVTILNREKYLFSWFYYAIETIGDQWSITPWSLNLPYIGTIDRIGSDASLPDLFKRATYSIDTVADGFLVTLKVISISSTNVYTANDTFCYIRIPTSQAFMRGVSDSQGDQQYVKMTVTDDGTHTIYQGLIPSAFELTPDKIGLIFNDKTVFVDGQLWISLLYGLTSKPVGYIGNNQALLPDETLALLLYEQVHLTLGHPLPTLWTNPHVHGDKVEYMKYPADVPYLVSSTSSASSQAEVIPFQIDDQCNIIYRSITSTTNTVTFNNEVVYEHRKGDLVLDPLGRPIPLSTDTQVIAFDITLISAKAMYATDSAVLDHLTLVQKDIVNKCTSTIPTIMDNSLERTNVYYRPINTMGEAICYRNGSSVGSMNIEISPRVLLLVPVTTYRDNAARKQLQDITVRTINLSLARDVISLDRIIRDLHHVYGGSVISVTVLNMPDILSSGGVSFNSPITHASIGVRLAPTSSNTLSLEDTISVEFELHQ